ncbi:MAG: UDP-N-acetylmuramoyl-L-alanyl-D-glutamate--2,6-diaminopimelate ligase [Saprospiraceae bacterium]|nr:UDP-N-acetylmuramoyl-L-alanyl-D-glutamate--2,6-diaminopimelate ligase [Saprospiraceae bacterium]
MKNLADILSGISDFRSEGSLDKQVHGFTFDSRKVDEYTVFVAKKGSQLDGHHFISGAVAKGCSIIFCQQFPENIIEGISYFQSDDLSSFLGKVLHQFYDRRISDLIITGVTGTNGKTTVASLLFELFSGLGYRCGLISTVENRIVAEPRPSTHTTPDQIQLYELLHEMHVRQCSHVFMEVSSHAIDQGRIDGLEYTCALFTNITHDHLDYHGTFRNYIYAKKKFFDRLNSDAFAILNGDDVNASVMVQNSKANKVFYSFQNIADHKGRILENSLNGLHLSFDQVEWYSKLMGVFNAYNLLAVYTGALCLGIPLHDLLRAMSALNPVEGRFEYIKGKTTGKMAIVDYAHTPDALQKILNNIIEIKEKDQQIVTVVGCGGDRDKLKRPLMASTACILSDKVILTSDNPRSEKPSDIIADMLEGVDEIFKNKVLVIEDREQAIRSACLLGSKNDIILVAGKGHEKYQEVKGEKLPFDDKKILNTFL